MKTPVIVLLIFVVLCVPSAVLAHKPLLTVEDNGDGTIYVETGFSDGSSGAGHKIILKDQESGDVLSDLTIPEEGYIEEIPIPNVPYTVTFDAGPGHVVVKDGPFSATEPAETAEPEAKEELSQAPAEESVESEPEPMPAAAAEPAQSVQPVQPSSAVATQHTPVQMPVMTTATMTPGMERALNMMMTSQMITALGVLVVLGAIMFLIGYMVGKDAGKTRT
jgi:hypothetical protein